MRNIEDLIELFEMYLDFSGEWNNFVEFIEDEGYSTQELGFSE